MNWHRIAVFITLVLFWLSLGHLCIGCSPKPLKTNIKRAETDIAIEIKTPWKAGTPWIIRGRELKRKWWREYGN